MRGFDRTLADSILESFVRVPEPEEYRRHQVKIAPQQWETRFERARAAGVSLSQPEALPQTLCREELFALGAQVPAGGAEVLLHFYIAVCAWGGGTSARSTARTFAPLLQPDALDRISAALAAPNPEGQYRAFNTHSQAKVKGLGPAFFTKLMHFAAPTLDTGSRLPLILDARVARSLGVKTSGWSTQEYVDYLELLHTFQTGRWSAAPLDAIEYALFTANGHVQEGSEAPMGLPRAR